MPARLSTLAVAIALLMSAVFCTMATGQVKPIYPRSALQQCIEGYVVVEFTVTEKGTVEDAVVIESNPPGVFDRAALAAVLKFKYRPRIKNGAAVAVHNVKNTVRFQLDESEEECEPIESDS